MKILVMSFWPLGQPRTHVMLSLRDTMRALNPRTSVIPHPDRRSGDKWIVLPRRRS